MDGLCQLWVEGDGSGAEHLHVVFTVQEPGLQYRSRPLAKKTGKAM